MNMQYEQLNEVDYEIHFKTVNTPIHHLDFGTENRYEKEITQVFDYEQSIEIEDKEIINELTEIINNRR